VSVASAGGRERLTVELIVRNAGDTPVGQMQPAVYLSNDPQRKPGDTLLWTRPVPALDPGQDTVQRVRFTLPAGVSSRGKYLIATADTHLALASAPPIAVYGPLR